MKGTAAKGYELSRIQKPPQSVAKHPPLTLAWSLWGLAGLLYLIGFFQRVAPAVMTAELMQDFGIGAAALGNLSGFYFYAYVAMQVPTGILADSLGPRKLLMAGSLVAAAGAFLFGIAPEFWLACLGRLLIGGAVAVAFVAILKLASHWFPPRLFALATGLTLLCGILGAVSAGTPLRFLVDAFGWRTVILLSAGFTVLIFFLIWLLVKDDPSDKGYKGYFAGGGGHSPKQGLAESLRGVREVFRYRNTWCLFLGPEAMAGSVLAFAGLWGVPYLGVRYNMPQAEAAALCSLLLICWGLAGPLMGWLSDRIGRRKLPYMLGVYSGLALWIVMLYLPMEPWLFTLLLALNGLANGAMVVGFAFGKESTPPRLAGTLAGVINMGTMIGPTVLQPAMGWVLDMFWQGQTVAGARVYSLEAYEYAFLLPVGWYLVSCLAITLSRETRCRQIVK